MKRFKTYMVRCCALLFFAAVPGGCKSGEVYLSEQYAFSPRSVEPQENGLEYYATDVNGGEYTGKEGNVPVFFCKYGNMVAVNVASYEKPMLWKVGNKVVVHTGNESGSPYAAHGKRQIVVMDADAGELSTADVTKHDVMFMKDMRRVEVKDHVVRCYNESGICREIPVQVKHRLSAQAQTRNRCAIADAVERGRPRRDYGKKWTDPSTGLEWCYVEKEDGVEICNKRTGGTAVSPKPKGELAIPGYINGKPVKCIGDNIIVNCPVETVRIPKTVERFSERAPFSLENNNLVRIEVENGNKNFRSKEGLLYDSTETVLLLVPGGRSKVVIPDGVTKIADSVFQNCYNLKSVTIPSSVIELGQWVFFNSGIKEVRFLGAMPKVPVDRNLSIYSLTPTALTTFARKDAEGWRVHGELPTTWCDRPIVFE